MAKLIHILAASVGGGLVLGASIRLGEAFGASARRSSRNLPKPAPATATPAGDDLFSDDSQAAGDREWLSDRLDRLEEKMQANSAGVPRGAEPAPEWRDLLAGVVARLDRQQTDVDAIRQQVGNATFALDSAAAMAENLHSDLSRQLSDDLDERLAAVEEKLHLSMKAANRETVNAMVASIETRVAPRISRLESEISGQSAAVAELRECALQSDRSVLRLLTALERTVNPKSRPTESEPGPGHAPEQGGAVDVGRPDLAKLSVVTNRGLDDAGGGNGAVRRPASVR